MKKYVFICILLICLLPIGLNFLLLIDSGYCVIQKDTTSAIWLAFWGSFLSAVGAFVMAFVSYWKNRAQQKTERCRIKYELAERKYNLLESFIVSNEEVHSYNNILKIFQQIDDSAPNLKLFELQTLEYGVKLQAASNKIVGFCRNQSKELQEYGVILADLNVLCVSITDDIRSTIKFINNRDIHQLSSELRCFMKEQGINQDDGINDIVNCLGKYVNQQYYKIYNENKYRYQLLCDKGSTLLISENKKLTNLLQQIDKQ